MANRADRRKMMRQATQKNKALVADYNRLQRIAGLIQNGITEKDLQEAYDRGMQEGFMQAGMPIIKSCYAGICIALKEQFGFGKERCYKALKAVDEKILYALNHQELTDEALEKAGIRIDFGQAFDRVEVVEK
jgi:hypothetical protein